MSEICLVAVDFSDATEGVLKVARQFARRDGCRLHLIHVEPQTCPVPDCEFGPVYLHDSLADTTDHQHRLEELDARLAAEGIDVQTRLLYGNPADRILEVARELDAAWILLGSHGHGMMFHLFAGSVCDSVLRRAPCPVVVVPVRALAESRDDNPQRGQTLHR
jgi:nucleotide-binding universal stress UspA family protein